MSSGQKGKEMNDHVPRSGALLAKSRVRGPTVIERRAEEEREKKTVPFPRPAHGLARRNELHAK